MNFRMYVFGVIVYSLFVMLNCANALGFDYLLQQLPELGGFGKLFESKVVLNVKDYGAKGDGIQDDTKVFTDVWDIACSSKVKSRIKIPDGSNCLVGPISIGGPCNSKVTLEIAGSIIAPSNPDVWNGNDTQKWLYFHNVDHLTVKGGGTINGMGHEWWATSCKTDPDNPCRHAPTVSTDAAAMELVSYCFTMSKRSLDLCRVTIKASRLSISAPASSPNTDGIHISESTNVEVKDTTVRTGDDCISIVSNSSKVTVTRIACGPGHGISIGSLGKSGTCDQVYDVSVREAFLSNTENGLRIKTWQGGTGFVRNVKYENVWMVNVSHPIIIDQYYCDSSKACPNETSAVNVENISYVNIKGTSANKEAIRFACSDVSPCEMLYLEDVELVSAKGGTTTSFCWEARGSSSGTVKLVKDGLD
ncbi:probable polygalacturonase [Tanacetum coccineum]